jgi:hypothetical protein
VHGATVVKVQDPRASRRERLRTLAGGKVARDTGLFVVPEIIGFDDERGELVFSWLKMQGIREVLSGGNRSLHVAGRAALVLAAIHRRMEPSLEAGPGDQPESIGRSEQRAVALHGDFGMRNLFWVEGAEQIALIDWANADWIGVDTDVGPPEIDIAVFLISLFHRRLLDRWPISSRRSLAYHFLRTYASESPQAVDVEALRRIVATMTPAFNRGTRQRKGTVRALAYRHSMIDLRFFLSRLSEQDLPVGPTAKG